jgi:lipopolysaccharide/colanic/teichoic acid biosynthesis glycosyltransferase
MDIVASFLGLFLLSPVFLLISIAIKRDTPGPVFYRGPRAGKDGKSFLILKFRTMYEQPESYQGPRVTGIGDLRVTPLGKWLRDTKINELPQLWNVLIGDMSLVGPRPEDIELVQRWPASLREELLSIRPGITSPATVVFREEEQLLSQENLLDDYLSSVLPNKLRIDARYIRRRSLLTDLDVIFLTLLLLLPRIKQSVVPETLLYFGPISKFFNRFLNWFVLDTLVSLVALSFVELLWRLDAPFNIGWQIAILLALAEGLCFSLFNSIFGLNHVQWHRASASEAFPLAFSTALSSVLIIFVNWALFESNLFVFHSGESSIPHEMLVTAGFMAFFGFLTLRYRTRLLTGLASRWTRYRRNRHVFGERVLVVGAGSNSQLAIWLLTHSDMARAFSIIGIVDDDPRKLHMYFDGFQVLGSTQHIPDVVVKYEVGLILYTISNIENEDRQRILQLCHQTPAKLVLLPDLMAEIQERFVQSDLIQIHTDELVSEPSELSL